MKSRARSPAGRSTVRGRAAGSSSSRRCTTPARRSCSARRFKAGGGEERGRAGARPARDASVDGAVTSRSSWRSASSPTSRRTALVDRAARRFTRQQRRPARGRAHDRHVAGVLRAAAPSRQGQDAARVRRVAPCARPAPTIDQRAADGDRAAQSRHAALRRQPPTGYSMTADAWVNTGALLEPHELRRLADATVESQATADRAAVRPGTGRDRRRPARLARERAAVASDRSRGDASSETTARDRSAQGDARRRPQLARARARLAGVPETVG